MLILTSPHSSEYIPTDAHWLKNHKQSLLLTDVDRFVNVLYEPVALVRGLPLIQALCHRYVIDLNRTPEDIDETQVKGISPAAGADKKFASGYHWVKTTKGDVLMTEPMEEELHKLLTEKFYRPFHRSVQEAEQDSIKRYGYPRFHLDLHSMPSQGTGAHKDAGQTRPDVVISDCEGKSCDGWFKDLVISSYELEGFSVAYNWPYKGGRMTEAYGKPSQKKHSVQVELNRKLYMDEETKLARPEFLEVSKKVCAAVSKIHEALVSKRKNREI